MSTLCVITGTLRDLTGTVLTDTTVDFIRTGVAGQDGSTVIPKSASATSDGSGVLTVTLYAGNYVATAFATAGSQEIFSVAVPDQATAVLSDLINAAPTTVTPQAVLDALAAQAASELAAANSATSATESAGSATAAAASAASAASVVQQDLSALDITMSYTPIGMVAGSMSDWSDQGFNMRVIQPGTSWYNETLTTGSWLGEAANETAARLVTGAGTGSYYHNTTDGKFYSLNVTSGQTEVFRGSKAAYPEEYIIIAEAARVIVFDATETDAPMWKVFTGSAANAIYAHASNYPLTSVALKDGQLWTTSNGSGGGGASFVNLLTDGAITMRGTIYGDYLGNLSQCNDGLGHAGNTPLGQLVSNDCNAVAITVLPNAPINSVTGMPVPTIAVATDGGVSVITDTGDVWDLVDVSGDDTNDVAFFLDNYIVYSNETQANIDVFRSIPTADSTTPDTSYDTASIPALLANPTTSSTPIVASDGGFAHGTASGITLLKEDPATPANGMVAYITDEYSTGWMQGDTELALCDGLTDRSATGTTVTDNGTAVIAAIATGAEQKKITATGGTITAPVTTGGAIYGWEYSGGNWIYRKNTGWVGVSESGGTLTIADGTIFSMLKYTNGAGPSAAQFTKAEYEEKPLTLADSDCLLFGSSPAITDLANDDQILALTSAGLSRFTGLRRVSNTAGSFTKVESKNGLEVLI